MSAIPTRLRYNDATEGMTTIGTMRTGSGDNMNTCTIKNSAEEYNKVVIEGDSELQQKLPVSQNQFGPAQNNENEPEILVEVFTNDSWSVRERCYAVEGGSVDDNGNYKNSKLYGHEKFLGEKRVETNTITTDIEDAMQELIPAGYSLQVPGDVTVPNVNNWSYKGRRENAFVELTRNYDWVLMFTSDLDSNNDYIVRFEPFGYGGSEGNIVRGEDPIVYEYWKKKDTKTIVSEVTVKGEDPSGSSVQETVQASNPDIDRSVTLNIGYPITVTEAQDIGNNLLQPNFVEHGKLQGPIFLDNTVNFTVGILDNELNINDEFTVAMQKDYLHEGQTLFSFEFENEANIRQSIKEKGLQEERDSLYPDTQDSIDIDFGDFNAENDSAEADNATSEDNQSPGVSGSTSTAFGDAGYNYAFEDPDATITDGGSETVVTNVPDLPSLGVEMYLVSANISVYAVGGADVSGDIRVEIKNNTNFDTLFDETVTLVGVPGETYRFGNRSMTIIERDPGSENDEIELEVTNNTGNGVAIGLDLTVDAIREHDHTTTGSADSHKHNVLVTDSGHGGAGDPSEHVITGDQIQKLINLLQELKTDRS